MAVAGYKKNDKVWRAAGIFLLANMSIEATAEMWIHGNCTNSSLQMVYDANLLFHTVPQHKLIHNYLPTYCSLLEIN
jgi:hypothetical protein